MDGTGLQPATEFAAFPNEQRQRTRASDRPRNSNQAQPGSSHDSHPRAPNLRNSHRGGANQYTRDSHHSFNDFGNKGNRTNRAPNQGRSFSSAPHINANTQKASQANEIFDRIKSQIQAVLEANDHSRTIPVPGDQNDMSPQPMTHPQATSKVEGGNAPVSNGIHRTRGGFRNRPGGKSVNETAKAHSQFQDTEYEKNGQALIKPQSNPISADKTGLKQKSLPSESQPSAALAASSLPDLPHVPDKSQDQSANHHQQINAALSSSNQQPDTRSQVEGNSAIRNCNMAEKHAVHHEAPLHRPEGVRGGRPGNNKGSQRGTSRWPRGCNSAAESYEESFGKDSTFDPSELDAVVNHNPYGRINIGRLPKYRYPGAKKTTETKPLRRIANAPSHHIGRAHKEPVQGTGTQKSIDRSLTISNSSGLAHEAEEAASTRDNATCTNNPSPATPSMAGQPVFQLANGGASQISPRHPSDGHAIKKEKHCQDVHSQGLSEAARSNAASAPLQKEVSSRNQHPNGNRQVLPPHLRLGFSKKPTVAVPSIFPSTTRVNETKDQKPDSLSEDTLSRKETKDNRHLGHGLGNIVNPSTPTAKVAEHHKSLASMSHHTDPAPITVNKAASEKVSEANWEGAWLDPPIGNDWNMRPQHPVEERKASTHAFAEQQAVDPEAAVPVVNIHSPSFLSGMPVLDDEGVHELNLNETRPRLKARPNGHASKSSKTAEDRIKEHAVRVANVEIVQPTAMTVEEKREIRRMIIKEHRNRPSPPNFHAPVANIYLRPVETKDAGPITELWNHFVANTTDVPTLDPDETVFWHNEIKRVIEDREPFLVAIIKGDNSSRSFREARRLKQEHVVGFARATDYGASGTVFRYTVELEVFVKDGHMRKGVGTCLFDRMMNALSPRYDAKNGVPLICTPKEGETSWRAGSWRSVKTILINLLGQENEEAVAWKKQWLEKEDFHQCGYAPNIGYKLGKIFDVHLDRWGKVQLRMAPIIPDLDEDDDFLRTISDDDTISYEEQDEDLEHDIITTEDPPTKKRKRLQNGDEHGQKITSSKGFKKRRKGGKSESEESTQADEDNDWRTRGQKDGAIDSDFEFDIRDEAKITDGFADDWFSEKPTDASAKRAVGGKRGADIDELVARRLRAKNGEEARLDTDQGLDLEEDQGQDGSDGLDEANTAVDLETVQHSGTEDETLAEDGFGMAIASDGEESANESADEEAIELSSAGSEDIADEMPDPEELGSVSGDEIQDPSEKARQDAFFAPTDLKAPTPNGKSSLSDSFQSFSLSRPILRGLASVGFTSPTPIQKKAIPLALLGKNIVGGAVTGSGKTAAFVIPILERLLYRPKKVPTTRVVILMPTRELAIQCFNVTQKLASYTDIAVCQMIGGYSLREQEIALRSRPDIVIATPGRFIDHMRNSASFTVDTVEILVLDEADRMLEDGFADELNEILTTIPRSRQTMLFSATMTDSVDKLIRLGLNRPVRLIINAKKQTVGGLVQEFVRLRPGREGMRLGYLLHLCREIYTDRVIIFFRQKKKPTVSGMSQEQRVAAIGSFTTHRSTHLLATDLASRGLDIPSVNTVINYSAPQSHEIYLHRVGRTARAGRDGCACTLAAEPDRKVVKAAVKTGRAQGAKIVSRVIEPQVADAWQEKADALASEVEDILREEKEERLLEQQDMQLRKGENLIEHEVEIHARPKRTWFESEKEKLKAKRAGGVELNDKKALDSKRERHEGRQWKKGKAEGMEKARSPKKAKGQGKRPKSRGGRA
ncbi:MAG: nucleolar DEAD-box protein required for synthesis of 60S ribosomal subunit [Ramalina farinacea]|uniref:RNA helicase n=1 Tax=Ramalina farinacea TaxID=258253 RepID=A0AA43TQP0_9LECA|nr:nucleolar DEAD-box protein required for synthesis of 60S ribosomal subunit [Ramalina farinacea]